MTRVDSQINTNWGTGSPDPLINGDNFMSRYSGKITITQPGAYTFRLVAMSGTHTVEKSESVMVSPGTSGAAGANLQITFQAVRMAVNDEPGALRRALEAGPRLLAHGGRLGVISFHSGEDRMVKQTFRTLERAGYAQLEPSPLTPGDDEVRANPRARSAKLRVLERTP